MTKKKTARKQPTKKVPAAMPAESLSAADILSGEDKFRAVPVATPEWKENSRAFVAELDADERDQLETEWGDYKDALDEEDNVGFTAFCVAFCLCDSERNRLFEGRVSAAAQKIRGRNAKATRRLFNTASRVNGLTSADIDALEGNSAATASDAGSGVLLSDSDSPAEQPGSGASPAPNTPNS